MSLFPKDVYLAIKSVLEASTDLAYVDVVEIQKYRRGNLPDFENYCIVINPILAESVPYKAAQRWIANNIELILLGKLRSGHFDAVVADNPTGLPPNVGVLAMYEDVYRTLYKNTLGGVIELYPGLNELDVVTRFDMIAPDEDREDFIFEVRMGYRPRGQRWVNLS
ncbi:hypothetical protein ES703_40873 [subsurface metagenome]